MKRNDKHKLTTYIHININIVSMYVCVCVFARIYFVFSKSGFEGNRIEITHRYSPHSHTDTYRLTCTYWRKNKSGALPNGSNKEQETR